MARVAGRLRRPGRFPVLRPSAVRHAIAAAVGVGQSPAGCASRHRHRRRARVARSALVAGRHVRNRGGHQLRLHRRVHQGRLRLRRRRTGRSLYRHWQTYALAFFGALGVFLAQNAIHAGPIVASQSTLVLVDPLASILIGIGLFGDNLQTGGAAGAPGGALAACHLRRGVLARTLAAGQRDKGDARVPRAALPAAGRRAPGRPLILAAGRPASRYGARAQPGPVRPGQI